MKVLQVNDADLRGRSFSGYDLLDDLAPFGVQGHQAVLTKQSDDPRVFSLWSGPQDERLHHAIWRVELRYSMNNVLFPWGEVLSRMPEFLEADVVHYHLPHNQMISLPDLERLAAMRPSVWTFHDMWPMTGHCIQPVDCDSWLTGCETCQQLNAGFVLAEDRASSMWGMKERVFRNLDIDVVVASEYMRDNVLRSPITSKMQRVHLIPFGIDADDFGTSSREDARAELGIGADDYVVLVRSSPQTLKGTDYLTQALAMAPPSRPTTVLSVDTPGLMNVLQPAYRLIDLGWLDSKHAYSRALAACDVFVMPSLAEGFGLMALEAMASSRPVVCFEGTAVASITRAPEVGVSVRMKDVGSLRAALDDLAVDSKEAERRGAAGRRMVHESYRREDYLKALVALYSAVAGK